MKKSIVLLLLLTCSVAHQSMAQSKKKNPPHAVRKTPPPSLAGFWELNYIEGANVEQLYKGNKPKINFDPKRIQITGNNSCNTFSGPIKIEGNKITFTKPLMQTLMACEGEGEQKFMEALGKVQTFAFSENDKLDFIAGDRGVMQFTRVIKKH